MTKPLPAMGIFAASGLLLVFGSCEQQSPRPEGWERYSTDTFNFAIDHPPDATVQVEGGSHTKFQVVRSDQPPAEVMDGFTFTVSVEASHEESTLRAYAEERIESAKRIGSVVEGISSSPFHGKEALRFRTRTLGEVQHVVFFHDDDRIVHLSWNISVPEGAEREYEETIDTMLRSFVLLRG